MISQVTKTFDIINTANVLVTEYIKLRNQWMYCYDTGGRSPSLVCQHWHICSSRL